MAFSCGFYDAIDNDRTYSATQFGEMFDGLITDGIYATIGDAFAVVPGSGVGVKVKPGRAWFNKTWSVNTADLPLTLADPDLLLSRIDAVILEVDTRVITRNNSIKVITGNPGIDPEKPTLIRADGIYQYPLAWVTVDKNISVIAASKIENNIGLAPTPFVTGILKSITIDELWTQWEGQFDDWFQNVQSQLEGNVALNLQHQIDQLKTNKVNVSDKASAEDIKNGIDDKWVDAKEVGNFVNNALTPAFGEATLTPTRYPMVGQMLSVSEHPEFFAKIGYKCGLNLSNIITCQNVSSLGFDDGNWYGQSCLGKRFFKIGAANSNYGNSILKHYKDGVRLATSLAYAGGYAFIPPNNDATNERVARGLLGETGDIALLLTMLNSTTSYLKMVRYANNSVDPTVIHSVTINTASTVMNKLNSNLSPYISGTTIKWPYLYTLNNLIYMGVVTISSYTTTPTSTTAVVQIPTTSDTVNWTNDSLEKGINRSIILDGKVYIHVTNKSGITIIYVYDLLNSSWVAVSTTQKNLVDSWTKKYANFRYTNTSYDSFKCMKIGSVKATPDGSIVEYGLIYVDPTTKEIKVHEDTTCILGKRTQQKFVEFSGNQFMTTYLDSSRLVSFSRKLLSDETKYSVYFQFYKQKAAIVVFTDGLTSPEPSVGIEYFDPLDKLVPIQPYISIDNVNNLNNVMYISGYAQTVLFNCGESYRYRVVSQRPNINNIFSEWIDRSSLDSSCRFGDLNDLAIAFNVISILRDSSNLDIKPTYSMNTTALYFYDPNTLDIPTGKFRLLDAHGVPLYYYV